MIPLARPSIGERERELVLECLESRQLSLGPMQRHFESYFSAYVGAAHAAAVSSGTAGLHLAVRAAGVKPGDEVITSPFSFVASANCVMYEGAKPVFVDVDPVTFNIDAEQVAYSVTERTSCILPVHIFGYPADLPAIEEIARREGLAVVEDGCEALGAVCADGARVGGRGNPTVFGFYPNKQMTTGEGGMVACGDAEVWERIVSERNQGRAPDMGWLDHRLLGYNYRLDEVSCAIGIAQLERIDSLLSGRARVAAWYGERLRRVDGVTLPCDDADGARRSWFVYVVQVDPKVDRDRLVLELCERGIQSKQYLPVIHLQPYMRERFGFEPGDFPVAESISRRSLALPFFPEMDEADVDRVCDVFSELLERLL